MSRGYHLQFCWCFTLKTKKKKYILCKGIVLQEAKSKIKENAFPLQKSLPNIQIWGVIVKWSWFCKIGKYSRLGSDNPLWSSTIWVYTVSLTLVLLNHLICHTHFQILTNQITWCDLFLFAKIWHIWLKQGMGLLPSPNMLNQVNIHEKRNLKEREAIENIFL